MAVDWESVSRHYRAGIRSLRDIGAEFEVSEGAIRKRAKKEEWPRDLSEKIKAKAEDLVRKEAVRNGTQNVLERELVTVNAQMQADIILGQRVDIPSKREFVGRLFKELEELTGNVDLVEQLTLALQQGDQDKLADIARKVASLPTRIKGTVDLVGAYKTLIGMEREVFGITSKSGFDSDPIAEIEVTIIDGRQKN